MYTILLVDDEPITFKSVRMIVEKYCPEMKIIGEAVDGGNALELTRKLHPDIIITDVKMPVMSGIELAAAVKEELPEIMIIMVSGYQDFEYAKGAIKSGACDYILKPIGTKNMLSTLRNVEDRVAEVYWENKKRLIRQLCSGRHTDKNEIRKYFGEGRYYVALVRKNGLPKRFYRGGAVEVFSFSYESVFLYGRDEQEGLYLYPEELVEENSFDRIVGKLVRSQKNDRNYVTALLSENPCLIEELPDKINDFYRFLSRKTTIGKSQILSLETLRQSRESPDEETDYSFSLVSALKEKKPASVSEVIKLQMADWKAEEKTQMQLEGKIRYILYLLLDAGYLDISVEELEFMIEDIFFHAVTMDELQESILSVIKENKKASASAASSINSEETFRKIKKYVIRHM